MIVKPAVTFIARASDAELIGTATAILAAMTDNPDFPNPAPALATVQAAMSAFQSAVAAAAGGGIVLTAAKNAARTPFAALLRELASYVHVACKGDWQKLLTSGFPTQKQTRQPVGRLLAPAGLTLANGTMSGELDAWATPVPGTLLYSWQVALASAPDTPVLTTQSSAASTTFTGLTPATEYQVIMNAVGTAGPSDWTDPANQIVI